VTIAPRRAPPRRALEGLSEVRLRVVDKRRLVGVTSKPSVV